MDNYVKGECHEIDYGDPDLPLADNVVHMKVNQGSKIRNLIGYAMKKTKEPSFSQITWNGSGPAITKTVSCAEIFKRKIKGLHQVTKIRFKRIEEMWDPTIEGLERLKVNRDIPAITVLLSKSPLDTSLPGYQAPGSFDAFWKKTVENDQKRSSQQNQNRHQSGGASSGAAVVTFPSKKQKRKKDDQGSGKSSSKKKDTKQIKQKTDKNTDMKDNSPTTEKPDKELTKQTKKVKDEQNKGHEKME